MFLPKRVKRLILVATYVPRERLLHGPDNTFMTFFQHCSDSKFINNQTDKYKNCFDITGCLQQYVNLLDPPSPPTSFTATFNSFNCSGDLELSWTPGASDRAIEMYILYDNGVEFKFINSTDSYSFSKTLENNRHYTYSIKAESCFGRSSALSSNVISVGG